jgi:cytochrome b pre-mRNA-processing protein 3
MAAKFACVYGKDETDLPMKIFPKRGRAERQAAERLYAAAVVAARRPVLYLGYGVPDTLEGRFEMMALHLFALVHRLMHDPGDDPELARLVAESFVSDMDGAFREMGVGDLSVPRRIKALYGSLAGRISAYKNALSGDDAAMAAAIARNVFPDGSEDARALPLALHLKATAEALRKADLAELRRGNAPFPEPRPLRNEEVQP